MSLRDQLLKAGLVDKKQVQKANRKLKNSRRNEQSTRDRKTTVDSREAELQARQTVRIKEERHARRKESEELRDRANMKRLVGNLVRSYGQSIPVGRHVFFYKMPDGQRLQRAQVPLETAVDLRSGKLAIGWTGPEDEPDFLLLPAEVAQRILNHEPDRILFFNVETPKSSDPSEGLADLEGLPGQRNR
jgi:uncharacterized protein YaiL (DUF2058 family)